LLFLDTPLYFRIKQQKTDLPNGGWPIHTPCTHFNDLSAHCLAGAGMEKIFRFVLEKQHSQEFFYYDGTVLRGIICAKRVPKYSQDTIPASLKTSQKENES